MICCRCLRFGLRICAQRSLKGNFCVKGVCKKPHKGGWKRLFAFVHICSRLLAFVCVFASVSVFAFVNVCLHLLHLLAFAYAPFCCAPSECLWILVGTESRCFLWAQYACGCDALWLVIADIPSDSEVEGDSKFAGHCSCNAGAHSGLQG